MQWLACCAAAADVFAGPCGPCSELYYDFHPERGTAPEVTLEDDTRFIEFYNLVFMELNRAPDGALTPLAAKNIDTGMGLERMAQILQGVSNNYETDLIIPIVNKAAELAGVDYATADATTKTALKVIGDHTRAVTYLISDGVTPSNIGRGYIVRRLLRRVVMKVSTNQRPTHCCTCSTSFTTINITTLHQTAIQLVNGHCFGQCMRSIHS
jgi:alanyl-tRNA synthetase